jgi:hypothetical protein
MRPAAAPRIDPRLLRVIERAASGRSAAELTRLVGEAAELFGLTRPSYEQVRVLRHAAREQEQRVSDLDVLVDIIFGARPATDLPNRWYGDPLPWRPAAHNEPRRSG